MEDNRLLKDSLLNGKVSPHDKEAETVVLGTIISCPETFEHVQNLFSPDIFYFPQHQIIAQAIIKIKNLNHPIDILTVSQEVKDKGVSAYDVSQISGYFLDQERMTFYTKILFQKYILRTIVKESINMYHKAHDAHVDSIELLSHADKTFKDLSDMMNTNTIKSIDTVFHETIVNMQAASKNNGIVGCATGIKEYDELINGLQPTFVYVIAARPSMGKSGLLKSIAVGLINTKVPCAIFSLEMSSIQFMKGILSDMADIHNKSLESGKLSDEEWGKVLGYQGHFNNLLFIDDTPSITIQYLESGVKRLVRQHGVKVVMIDYMQLMTLNKNDRFGRNREQEVSYLSVNIKRIAKTYNVAIINLAQLSRSVEERKPPRPILSDLRESGSIEQDADVVTFIYRPAYYKIFTDGEGNDLSNTAELIVAKNRFGATKSAYANFVKEKTRFENIPATPEKAFYTHNIDSDNDF